MQRGGRGSFGRGQGGAPGIGNAPFGEDLKPDYSVTELFPPQPPPVQSYLSKEERAMIARYQDFKEKIHNGPMYTVTARRGMDDPFNGFSKYSSRYSRQTRKLPDLDSRPYVCEFFPAELYPTIGKDKSACTTKRLLFSALHKLNPLDDLVDMEDGDEADEDGKEGKKIGLNSGAVEDVEHDVEDMGSDEEPDDFADDEEGDYNAEQYFGDGDDIGDDYGDDDGGGDYY